MRRGLFGAALGSVVMGGAVFASPPGAVAEQETAAQRRERLEKMSAKEKEAIQRNKDRFDALPEEEKERLRKLAAQIDAAPKCDQLKKVMANYNEWLKTLSEGERATVLDIKEPDKRIAKIKEIQSRQHADRLRTFARDLSTDDVDAIYSWLERFVKNHEPEFLAFVPERYRIEIEKETEQAARLQRLMFLVNWRFQRGEEVPKVSEEEINELVGSLSPKARAFLEQEEIPELKQQAARELVKGAIFSKFMPRATEEELRKFAKTLDPAVREKLEGKSPDEMKRDLRRMFFDQMRRGGFGKDGRPRGPFPPGDRPPPPGDGRRPKEERPPQDRPPSEGSE